MCVTSQAAHVREAIAQGAVHVRQAAVLSSDVRAEGVAGPADLAIVGGAAEVEDGIAALASAGVTDFAPSEHCLSKEERDDTRIVLKNWISGR